MYCWKRQISVILLPANDITTEIEFDIYFNFGYKLALVSL